MRIIDANVMIYSVHSAAPQHEASKEWWEDALADGLPTGIPWSTLLAFLRVTTHPRVFLRPLGVAEAVQMASEWLAAPGVQLIEPGPTHAEVLLRVAADAGVRGPELTDAHLAALAIERSATLVSTDRGFRRFRGLKWLNPLDPAG